MMNLSTLRPALARCLLVVLTGIPAALSAQAPLKRPLVVAGVVFDSIGNRPLVGASVQLAGIDSSVALQHLASTSDSLGRFRFAAVPPGRYLLGFYHAALDTSGIEPRGRLVDVRTADQEVLVAGPSAGTIVRTLCGDNVDADRATLLLGHLHHAETEAAIPNGSVAVSWTEPSVVDAAIYVDPRTAVETSREDGWFALCGLPSETMLEVRGRHGTDSSGPVAVRLARNGVQHLSLFVGATNKSEKRSLAGRVTNGAGQPVMGAQVWLTGTDRRTTTTAAGSYELDSLPAGTQSLTVRAIGYSPQTVIVTLSAPTSRHDVALDRAVVLPTMTTLGASSSRNLAAFESHKRSSAGGFFVRPARLEGYASLQTLHTLVQGLPGVTVTVMQGQWVANMQRPGTYVGAATVPCAPQIFLNGVKDFLTFDDLEQSIDPDDILGVEVYTRELQIPSVYGLPINQPCGLISVWTRAHEEQPEKKPPLIKMRLPSRRPNERSMLRCLLT